MITQTTWRAVKETPYVAGLFVWVGLIITENLPIPTLVFHQATELLTFADFPKDVFTSIKVNGPIVLFCTFFHTGTGKRGK